MPPFRKYRPGQRVLSAGQLNDILADLHSVANLDVDGGTVSREGGIHALNIPLPAETFWARIDDESDGMYAWTEQERNQDGTYRKLDGGRAGTFAPVRDYAREASGKRAVPVGLVVRMAPGTPFPSESDPARVNAGWVFTCPDLTAVIDVHDAGTDFTVGTGETDATIAYVTRFHRPDNELVDAQQCVAFDLATGLAPDPGTYLGRLVHADYEGGLPLYAVGIGRTGICFKFLADLTINSVVCDGEGGISAFNVTKTFNWVRDGRIYTEDPGC